MTDFGKVLESTFRSLNYINVLEKITMLTLSARDLY